MRRWVELCCGGVAAGRRRWRRWGVRLSLSAAAAVCWWALLRAVNDSADCELAIGLAVSVERRVR